MSKPSNQMSSRPERRMRTFAVVAAVLLVWAVMSVWALRFVAVYGTNMPWMDDWMMLGAYSDYPPLIQWLWLPHNEHRIPLAKALLVWLASATQFDARSGMYVVVVMMSGLALGGMLAAWKMRGRPSLLDAIFVLLLLNGSHADDYLMFSQLFYTLYLLKALTLMMAFGMRAWNSRAGSVVIAAAVALLPLSGGPGLPIAAATIPVLGALGVREWRLGQEHARTRGAILIAGASLSVALIGLYFIGYAPPGHHPHVDSIRPFLRATAQYASMGFGLYWHGYWRWVGSAVFLLASATTVLLLMRAVRQKEMRWGAIAMLAFLAGFYMQAMAVGWGRALLGPWSGWSPRYCTLSAVLPLTCYVAWARFGGRRGAAIAGFILTAWAAAFMPNGFEYAEDLGGYHRETVESMIHDLRAGMTWEAVADKHHERILPGQRENLAYGLELLYKKRHGIFAKDDWRDAP